MFTVIACIRDQHDWRLIIWAAAVCVVGSLTTMLLLQRVQECEPSQRGLWTVAAAIAGGGGIWATHFISMLAYDAGLPVGYDPRMTVLSIVVAIAAAYVAVSIAFKGGGDKSFALGGAMLGLGVAAMHLSGMMAIDAPARVVYDAPRTAAAVLIGVVFCALSLLSFHRIRNKSRLAVATGLLVLGICSMHFTSMSGVQLHPDPTLTHDSGAIDRSLLASIVIAASTALILTAFGATFLDRHLTDLRGLANASLEGLLIVRGDQILDMNERLAALSGYALQDLAGRSPGALFTVAPDDLAAPTGNPLETMLLHADGGRVPIELHWRTVEYRGRESHVLVIRDLTERKQAERQIEHLAHHDALTDLPNRALFDHRMAQAIRDAERQGEQVAIFCLDLDRFKAVNDIFGHGEGDRVLCKVADILRATAGPEDTVARIGGDEFAIIQTGAAQPETASRLAGRLLAAFAKEMDLTRDPKAVGVSIGVAVYPTDGAGIDDLRTNADTALYRAKRSGRGGARFFDAGMDQTVRTRRELGHDLRHAILRRQLSIAYQPVVDADSGQVAGYEALLRWRHPDRGQIGPDIFIPIAEESGVIVELGEWVLTQACIEAARWNEPLTIAVNVSPVQLQLPNFCQQVADALKNSGLDGSRLELEITEAVLMHDRDAVLALLHRLRRLGVGIVMDDFGTGFSSLNNLQSFPFDKIKIDRSFTAALESDPAAQSIVRAIIGLGRSLDLPVVSEGVETEGQRQIMIEQGCSQLQGFLLGRPGKAPSRASQTATYAASTGS